MVYFHDDVAVQARFGFSFERIAGEERHVGHVGGEVEEERAIFVLFDEADGAVGVFRREKRLVFAGEAFFGDGRIFEQGQGRVRAGLGLRVVGPHVIGVGDAEVLVEAVLGGKKLWVVAEVPFSGHSGGVAALFEERSDGGFGGVESDF